MSKKDESLKLQKNTRADIIIELGAMRLEFMDCEIFANSDKQDLTALFQDKKDPAHRVQIMLKKLN